MRRLRRATLGTIALLVFVAPSLRPSASAGPTTKVADAPYPEEFRAGVRQAITSGVKYLRTQQMRGDEPTIPLSGALHGIVDNGDYQEAAAVLWVLRRAGLAADDPAFARAWKTVRSRAPNEIEEAVLVLLALAAQPLAEGNPFTLEETPKAPAATPALSKDDRALMEGAARLILSKQVRVPMVPSLTDRAYDDTGGWGFDLGSKLEHTGSDVPTTYLALLGLEAAARCGVVVPGKVHLAALDLLLGWQAPKGPATVLMMNAVKGTERSEWTEKAQARGFGFGGVLSDSPSGYETVAGALGLIACQDALQKDRQFTKPLRQRTRSAIRDALAWVQANYDITKNPSSGKQRSGIEGPLYHHHWLQGLARLEIHARMRFVGTHDWFQEGADVLRKAQQEDGAWDAIWWANCYALLFLLRASLTSIVPVVTESEPGR